jgi:hypothetical protein
VAMAVGPTFNYGVPKVWVGIEKDDPPVFESQAAYLIRPNLTREKRMQGIANAGQFDCGKFRWQTGESGRIFEGWPNIPPFAFLRSLSQHRNRPSGNGILPNMT